MLIDALRGRVYAHYALMGDEETVPITENNKGSVFGNYFTELLVYRNPVSHLNGRSLTWHRLSFGKEEIWLYQAEKRDIKSIFAEPFDNRGLFQEYLVANAALVDSVERGTTAFVQTALSPMIGLLVGISDDEDTVNSGNTVGSM